MAMTQLTPISEHATAVLTSHMDSGEDFEGAIVIGYYPGNDAEIWFQSHGVRTNVHCGDVDALCKQLKRAVKLAKEANRG